MRGDRRCPIRVCPWKSVSNLFSAPDSYRSYVAEYDHNASEVVAETGNGTYQYFRIRDLLFWTPSIGSPFPSYSIEIGPL